MKNTRQLLLITLLLAIFQSMSAQRDWRSYEMRNFGSNLTNAENLLCSSNPETKGSRFRFEIGFPSTSTAFETKKLYKFTDDDDRIRYIYIVRRRSTPYSDRDAYLSSQFVKLNTFCDDDYDGIENSLDNCPIAAGPESNGGCPRTDLIINSDTEISAPAWGNHTLYHARYENAIFLSRFNNGFITITKLLIDNLGDGRYPFSEKVKFYISKDAKVSNDDFKFSNEITVPGIPANSQNNYATAPGTKLLGSSVGDKLEYGSYYLLIEITPHISETSDTNNVFYVPLDYIPSWTNPGRKIANQGINNDFIVNTKSNDPHPLTIYNLSGQIIKQQIVADKNEEQAVINSLDKQGLYIVKSGDKTYKVAK